MNNHVTLTQAITGYTLAAQARHLSEHTLADYQNTYRKLLAFLNDDPPFTFITRQHIESFLAVQTVSKKTILNYHTGLSALWTWAVKEGLASANLLHQVERPRPEKRAIVPFTEADIRTLLAAISSSRPYTRPGKRECVNTQPTAIRNRAIILLLLDTGMRASELCNLCIHHLDQKNRRVRVFGKGSKERSLPISVRTSQAIWKYLTTREDNHPKAPLFTANGDTPFNRDRLLKQLNSIGSRAGVRNVHPHRFRHTFAIVYLRNGGNPWTLQVLLGHSTMEMVRTYLALAQTDLDDSHRTASPVDNWRL